MQYSRSRAAGPLLLAGQHLGILFSVQFIRQRITVITDQRKHRPAFRIGGDLRTDLLKYAEEFRLDLLLLIAGGKLLRETGDQKTNEAQFLIKACVFQHICIFRHPSRKDIRDAVNVPVFVPEFIIDRKASRDLGILQECSDQVLRDRLPELLIDLQGI